MRQRIQKKINHLRQQPPDMRIKTVSSIIIGGGTIVLLLWLFLLLPIQLHFQGGLDNNQGLIASLLNFSRDSDNSSDTAKVPASPTPSRPPQVGGIQQYQRPLPSGPFFKTAPPGQAFQQRLASPSPLPPSSSATKLTPSPVITPSPSPIIPPSPLSSPSPTR